jgi:sortase (surface protein transpeptidase)
MLAPKQLSKQKLYIYSGIIALMIFGTLFLLYQNYRLTAKRTPVVFDIPAESEKKSSPSAENEPSKSTTAIADSNAKGIEIPEFDIFNSRKYRALKEGVKEGVSDTIIGRRNPFEL